jgi:DNA-binding XRE family transcriptional regulator
VAVYAVRRRQPIAQLGRDQMHFVRGPTGASASRMDLREVFATNLRRLRHEKGLSQDELAAEVSRSYLAQLEKGAYYASLKIIGRVAEALNVEPAELLKLPLLRETPDRR